MRKICVMLARLKHNFTDAYLEEEEPYFKIEQSLPVEVLSPLQTTFCALDGQAMLKAAQTLCRFYLDLAPGLAEAHHLPYQVELEHFLIMDLQKLGDASSS